jgi:copper(I)-binding protein
MLSLTACSGMQAGLTVQNAWARESDRGGNSAVYFVIVNDGPADRLLAAESPVTDKVMLHKSILREDGTAEMEHQHTISIGAGSRVIFEPGGLHVMLISVDRPLIAGSDIPLTLVFDLSGRVELNVPIKIP